jgi:hypothetical protein
MGLFFLRSILLFCTFYLAMLSSFSYDERYYDPVTSRYIQKDVPQRIPRERVQVKILTQEEIQAEKERLEQERFEESERLRKIRESAGTESRRRYDPTRYHRTEEVVFTTI